MKKVIIGMICLMLMMSPVAVVQAAGDYFISQKDFSIIPNNGGTVDRDSHGNPILYTEGDTKGYMIHIGDNTWKRYVSDIKAASADSKEGALKKLATLGCDYFVDENYATDGGCTVIGFMRTDNKEKAITDVVGLTDKDEVPTGYKKVSDEEVAGHILYVTSEPSMGNPIYDMDAFEDVDGVELSSVMLTDMRLSRSDKMARQFILADESYKEAAESDKIYLMISADTIDGKDIGLALVTDGEGLADKRSAKTEFLRHEEQNSTEKAENPAGEEETADSGGEDETADPAGEEDENPSEGSEFDNGDETTEENIDVSSGEESDETGKGEEEVFQGTVLNVLGDSGTTVFFIVLWGMAVLIPVITVIIKRIMEKRIADEEGKDDYD